jgi:hypothetical protein
VPQGSTGLPDAGDLHYQVEDGSLIEKAVRIKKMVGARPYHRRIPDLKEIRRC